MILQLPIIFDYDSEHKKFQIDFRNYGVTEVLPVKLNGVINENNSVSIDSGSKEYQKLKEYLNFELPPLEINENLGFKLQTIHKIAKEWKVDFVTKKNFSYFFSQSEIGTFTQNSIIPVEKNWSINSLNFEILSQLYVFSYLKPIYDYEFAKIEKINESQLNLEDYQTLEPEKLITLDENIFLEFKKTAYWDEEITLKKTNMDKDQFKKFKL